MHESPPSFRLRLRRGHVLDDPPIQARALHLARLVAAVDEVGAGSYFTLSSAAVIHGLPLWGEDLNKIQVVHTLGGHGQRRAVSHTFKTPLVRPSTTVVDGLRVTSLPRTAADLMRRLPFGPALAVADAALRLGATREEMWREVATGRGCRIAQEAVRRADPRSESPYESMVRAIILQNGLPLPDLQVEFSDATGLVGRVDFRWKRERLVGEFDGAVKLDELLAPGQDRLDALRARGVRDDRLAALGQRVIHWEAADVHEVGPIVASLRHYLGDVQVDHGLCAEARGLRKTRNRSPRHQ